MNMVTLRKFKLFPFVLLLSLYFNCSATLKNLPSEQQTTEQDSTFRAYEHFVRGDWLDQAGAVDSALQEYQSALSLRPDIPEIRLALAKALFGLRKWDEALDQGLKIEPKSSQAWNFLGDCYSVLRRTDDAIFSYQKAVSLDSTDVHAYSNLTFLYHQQGEVSQAISAWTRISEIYSFNTGIRRRLASMLLENGRYDEAIDEYNKIIQLDSRDIQAWIGLGTAYQAKKEFGKAVETYEKAVRLNFYNVNLHKKLIPLYVFQRKMDKLKKEMEAVHQLDPKDEENTKRLGSFYLLQEDYQTAESLFTRDLEKDSSNVMAHLFLGRVAFAQGDPVAARKSFRKVISLREMSSDGWVGLALTYTQEDSLDQAIMIYEQALERVTDKKNIYYPLGLTYNRVHKFELAISALERAMILQPDEPRILFALGTAYEREGRFDFAVSIFERLLEIEPDNAQTLNYLGYMLAEKGIRLDQSVEMIKSALEKDPENGAYLDSYGWAFFKLGQLDQAEEKIRKALEFLETDAVIHEHLGDILQAKGRGQEAMEYWERALELDPDNEGLRQKLEK